MRLRTECSVLKEYIFDKKNLAPNASCVCEAIENNFHVLMECQKYDIMRRGCFKQSVGLLIYLKKVLLFGDSNLSNRNNEIVFKAVHKYIHQTKIFSSGN